MNVTQDTLMHIKTVSILLHKVAQEIYHRALYHDASKLASPEAEMFEIWRPKLDELNIESDEYKDALKQMEIALQHHYAANYHHPEHFENGINGMTLIDVIEMVCDWKAAAGRKNEQVNLEWAHKRFSIEPQLLSIIENTLKVLK